jgi:hypothetical protein
MFRRMKESLPTEQPDAGRGMGDEVTGSDP